MRLSKFVLLIAAIMVFAVIPFSSYAQGTTSDNEGVSCDAELILTLYVAERFFDFSSFNSQLSSDMMVSIDDFDKGQFAPLFDHAGMMEDDMLQMSDQMRDHMNDMMAMSDDEFQEHIETGMMPGAAERAGTDISAMTMLSMNDVADEATECAALRTNLRRFFVGLAFAEAAFDGMSTSGMDTGASMDAEATAEAEMDTTDTSTAEGALTVQLSGANEVPGPGDDDGAGTAVVYLRGDSNEVCVDLTVQNIVLPAAAAHIHRGAAGEAGPPVVTLTAPGENGLSNTCATVEADLMEELITDPQNFYVNVHSSEFPDGAVRGQLQ